ncbi:hypothetical protein GO988_17310 [Hymenobacter sp. HMF4947]|uniref:Secreted protein n=1 Tax=Hymenobacter ginkgonis TaxID=2682976 RepID=A0A7K1TIT6_9BACT|nr:hypothetical protein [Hymenobacter ginkgonis]MVN78091.1 hypothetical protein [Hymenobacter ginkgonis]
MKTFLFATLAAAFLTTTSVFAAPIASQDGRGYPPVERGRDTRNDYGRAYRPDFRERDRRPDGRRYDRQPNYSYNQGLSYGYEQPQPVILQPRRPVGISINVQL